MKVSFLLIPLLAFPTVGQTQEKGIQDVDDVPLKPFVSKVQPPADIRDWTPNAKQFRLYVNAQGSDAKALPLDILSDKGSWPFVMQKVGDTVYVYIVPPGYTLLERSVIDHLPTTFPLVVWAGTERAMYSFSYDGGQATIRATQTAPFISLVEVKPLPENVLCWQLKGSGNSAGEVQRILKALDGQARPIQLQEGFYQGQWHYIMETSIRNWKLNETSAGTLVALELSDVASRESIQQQLRKLATSK